MVVFLAYVFGVVRNYLCYFIVYNWLLVFVMALSFILYVFYVAGVFLLQLMMLMSLVVFVGLVYVSWYVVLCGLEIMLLIAFAFLFVDYVLSFVFGVLIW